MKELKKRTDFLVFGKPRISQAAIDEAVDTLKSGWIGTGRKVTRFEEDFKGFIGCEHAIAVSSATAALALSLEIAGVKQGDEVITTPMTYCSTANVIVHRGAKPVFVDVQPDTFNIDPEKIEKAITPRTKAILPVHFAGHPADMDEINEIAEKHNLFVIEDAAHAVGSEYKGVKIGNSRNLCCFSFYPNKVLTTIEGGMITFNGNAAVAERIRALSQHGTSKHAWKRFTEKGFTHYDVVEAGYKYNMTDVQASLGIHQLAELPENYRTREIVWKTYDKELSKVKGLRIPVIREYVKHSLYIYPVLVDPAVILRDELGARLQDLNMGVGIHYLALHTQSFYRKHLGTGHGMFPVAEQISDRTLSLPLSANMTEKDAREVAGAVREIVAEGK